jgi:Spy/CpxP family protein refolding chaperone
LKTEAGNTTTPEEETVMKKGIAIAAALLVVAVAGVAAAHMRRGGPEDRAGRIVARVAEELSLDAGQKEELGKLVAGFQPVAQEFRSVRRETRAKVAAQLKAGAFDAEAVKAAAHANLAALEKSADQFIERFAAFQARLTPEQKAKVAEKLEKSDDWRDGRCEERGRGGRPHDQQR